MRPWTHRLAAATLAVAAIALALGATTTFGQPAGEEAPAARLPVLQPAEDLAAATAGGPERRYIVELEDPPLARYTGGIGKLRPTAAWLNGDVHLDVTSAAARAYLAHLDRAQDEAEARVRGIAPGARFDWRYRYVFNGFAARLTPEQALRVVRLPGVVSTHAEERYEPEMDGSLALVGADEAFEQVGGIEEAGLGARIAIVDSGLDSNHPFLNDEGMPAAPTGFPTATMHLRDGSVHAYPEPERFVNNKVIAARIFVSPEVIGETDVVTALQQLTPLGQGHGLHVSGTAAGRDGTYQVDTSGQTVEVTLSGVAPMAQVFNYKANYATSPEYVAMMDQMVLDRIDVLNMSQGHVAWLIDRPETHPIARAFDGAFDAGVLPVMSAGNAGSNGLVSLSGAFKYSEKVMAVGNSTSPGSFDVKVMLTGEDAPLDTLAAAPRGVYAPDAPIEGELYLAPDGGCAEAPEAAGKIAVIDRYGAGTCGYTQRAQFMADSGALAALFVYNDRSSGGLSTTALALPSLAIGTNGGDALMTWLQNDGRGRAEMDNVIRRGLSDEPDVLSGGSSRGPGIDWTLKPDITAPGSGILSSYYVVSGGQYVPGFAALSGTSMSSPHVAGAAALVRSAHPQWSTAHVRSALINTSARTIKTDYGPSAPEAAVYEAGPGRLDLRSALDPGAVLNPPKASFGKLVHGESEERTFVMQSVSAETETWTLSVDPVTGTVAVVSPETVEIAPGETATFTLRIDTAGAERDEHWGDVLLHRDAEDAPDARPPLRLAYFAYAERPEARKDVLVVNWAYGETPDHTAYYTETLEALGLTYDVWTIRTATPEAPSAGHVPFKVLQRYDLVVLNQNESIWAFQESLPGAYQYQNLLLHGGNMLIAGQGQMNWWRFLSKSRYPDNDTYRNYCGDWWPYCFVGPSQNAGCDMCLPRYFAGFTYGVTATLSGRLLAAGEPPDRPEREVVLPAHASGDGAFPFGLDLSTGAMAKDGAAGNQYAFASGELLTGYEPSGDTAVEGRDYGSTEGVFDRVRPYARPLWQYTGDFVNPAGETEVMTKVVGTYVAGKQEPEAAIAWNAMFWGFGLEGVGAGAQDTVGRDRLMGDTFNFLARNLRADRIQPRWEHPGVLMLALPDVAEVPLVGRVDVDWGDGSEVETITIDPPQPADALALAHTYDEAATVTVRLDLYPVAHAAPIYGVSGEIEAAPPVFEAFLPVAARNAAIAGGEALADRREER